MKDQKFPLRPASREEAGLFYSNDERDEALGTVGHLRMDFGSGGKGFYHTWWPHNGDRLQHSRIQGGPAGICGCYAAKRSAEELGSHEHLLLAQRR